MSNWGGRTSMRRKEAILAQGIVARLTHWQAVSAGGGPPFFMSGPASIAPRLAPFRDVKPSRPSAATSRPVHRPEDRSAGAGGLWLEDQGLEVEAEATEQHEDEYEQRGRDQ